MLFFSLLICLLAIAVHAAPAARPLGVNLGVKFDKRQDELPTLTLPYGTWRASEYNADADVYTFKNIRFAAPPTGENRWRKPQPPINNDTVQDGSYGPICVQAPIEGLNLLGPGNNSPIGGAVNQFLGGIPVPIFDGGSEDCLFLDFKDALDLIGFYSGTGLIQQTGGNVIYVAGNYRLGTYGFLAGETMENEGVPNAGFWDQRAVFQWVQDYIGLVGGDPTNVNAWGESAGAGSILHHLTAQGGTLDPLFKKAVVQSSAFQIMWDRKGGLERGFQNFSALAGCEGQGLDCLRAADPETLDTANEAFIRSAPLSAFNIGPSADGDYVRQLPMLELASGNYWKGLESLIVSHTADEAELFVDGHIQTDEQFNDFIDSVFPNYTKEAGINAAIEEFFPPVSTNKTYGTVVERTKAFVRDSSFTCWSRFLTDAYAGRTWNMQYSVTPGWHGTDLLPTFYQIYLSFGGDVAFPLLPGFGSFATAYQSYLTSHARSGDPNTYSAKVNLPPAINWPRPATGSENVGKVLDAGNLGFSLTTDEQLPKSECDFIRQLAAAVTNVGGYAVPGTVQPQSLVDFTGDPSANY
ncbi:Carboxylesterase type B [Macrophomina phaseolina MS6]|uniref:Carboxylesterase type B n=1 Tax=Macrophomina phaseolina (strain MS6) TaxID=1126212 RepID=K2SMI1_MACPH|nr:Carboxylesterase type B [Macrophomina phaseolina MS6]